MSYDLVLIGGTGGQFGVAVLESVALGILAAPRSIFVVDADRNHLENELQPRFERYVLERARLGGTEFQPALEGLPPYTHPRPDFTIRDLLDERRLSGLGEVCLTDEEAGFSIREGLYCMPKLGGVVMGIEDGGNFRSTLVNRLASNGGAVPIVLAGSVAGGTGAGFLTPLLKALREDHRLDHRPIYAMVFLPWFSLQSRGEDAAVGPSNLRMRRNASQGVRNLERVLSLPEVQGAGQPTYAVVLGLPPGAEAPERRDASQSARPGPLLYYAASLMSGDFHSLRQAQVTHGLPTGIYTVRCNGADTGPCFARRVLFIVEIEHDGGTKQLKVPFEALNGLLEAQEKALRELSSENRFVQAFGRLLDNPDFLPRSIFDALKQGRASTAERQDFGRTIARALQKATEEVRNRRARLEQDVQAEEGTTVRFSDLPEAQDWWEQNLRQMPHLDGLLRLTPGFTQLLANAVGQGQKQLAAEILVQSLFRGLASSPSARAALQTFVDTRGNASSVALPTNVPANGPDGTFVALTRQTVQQLADALMQGGDMPNSQCIPTPLARAHAVDYICARSTSLPVPLAASPAGRVVLQFLGLSTGQFKLLDRIHLPAGATLEGAFERTVLRQESTQGDRPYRADWIHLVAAPDGRVVGATSPQSGFFDSVRVDETRQNPLLPIFAELEQSLGADQKRAQLRRAYAVFLDDVRQAHPSVVQQSWYRVLALWTEGEDVAQARSTVAGEAIHAVGPVPLQMGPTTPQGVPVSWVWLPMLMPTARREHLVALLGSIASSPAPLARAESDAAGREVRIFSLQSGTELLALRPFQGARLRLSPEDDLRAGALEVLRFHEGPAPVPRVSFQWREVVDKLRLRLATIQRTQRPVLDLVHLLPALGVGAGGHAPAGGVQGLEATLGLDNARHQLLTSLTAGPFAPGLVNLVAGCRWNSNPRP